MQLQRALQRQLAAEHGRVEDVSAVIQEVPEDESMEVKPAPQSDLDQDHATLIHQLRHHPMRLWLDPTHLPELLWFRHRLKQNNHCLIGVGYNPHRCSKY
ncbi:hypothetical protein QCA50_000972 [Cerrena zonata]|uniref:Uncharacterized protein n=1 Tax=Cerrena zonata TaxID=2478898 RepID=A0AAW0GYV7_9APHY